MDLVNVAPGQCRVQVDSSSQVSIRRYAGSFLPLKINGAWRAKLIPQAGVAVTNAGLVAATLHYLYAFDNSGVIAGEISTTGHTPDADVGVEIKSGDPSRTLLAMLYTGAGSPGTFVDSATQRLLANWFNRRNLDLTNVFTANRTTTSTSFVELNTEIRIEAVVWSDEATALFLTGHANIPSAGFPSLISAIGEDGASTVLASVLMNTGIEGASHNQGIGVPRLSSEGRHFWTALGRVSGNTGTWGGGADDTNGRIRLSAIVRG